MSHGFITTSAERLLRVGRLVCHPLVVLAAMFLVVVWVLTIRQIDTERRLKREALAGHVANLALAFEKHVSATVGEIDNRLKFIRSVRELSGNQLQWTSILRADHAVNQVSAQISVIDAAGNMVASTNRLDPDQSVNLSDREHFRAHAQTLGDNLFISKPLLGRLTRAWSIKISRPIRDENRKFAGVIVISLDPGLITKGYEDIKLGEHGGGLLVGRDDIIRAAFGASKHRFGHPMRERDLPNGQAIHRADTTMATMKETGRLTTVMASRPVSQYQLDVIVSATGNQGSWSGSDLLQSYILLAALCTLAVSFAVPLSLQAESNRKRSIAQRNEMEIEKKVAESRAMDRSLFLAVMSHEIRTPLNGVLGALDLIRNEKMSTHGRHCVNIATESGESLLALIDDILVLTKFEHDKVDLTQEAFYIQALLGSVSDAMRPILKKSKNEMIFVATQSDVSAVIGDAGRLRQVLVNLISNANKFTANGTITLKLDAATDKNNVLTATISVIDTGIGIPPDKQKIIFNRFQTLDATYTRRTDGTGLGLAICDKIVRAMGSEILVESEPGQGSCFSFSVSCPLAPAQTGRPPRQPWTRTEGALRSMRILLAEDNLTNAFVATQMLKEAGHSVHHAVNGLQALQAAQEQQFDLILMDVSMPEMDGVQASERIKSSNSRNASTPIIALTAHAISSGPGVLMMNKMDGYLTKPIRKSILLNTINQAAQKDLPVSKERSAAIAHTSGDIIDLAVFSIFQKERSDHQAAQTVAIFMAELGQKAQLLRSISDIRDTNELGMLAHSLRGASNLLGATRLADASKFIEETCEQRSAFNWNATEALRETIMETMDAFKPYAKSADTIDPGDQALVFAA
jgi:two-component system, sensor histidine kinase